MNTLRVNRDARLLKAVFETIKLGTKQAILCQRLTKLVNTRLRIDFE